MAKAKHYGADGKVLREIDLPATAFGKEPNAHVVWEAVKCYLANQRQGTASTKTISFVRGGGAKPWRQKGTGRARAGSRRSPIWVGGATIFGPKPRSYKSKLPRKIRRLAIFSALSQRALDGKVGVYDEATLGAPRTKDVSAFLKAIGMEGTKVCFITRGSNQPFLKSARNITGVSVLPHTAMNVYDLVNAEVLLVSAGALEGIQEVFGA